MRGDRIKCLGLRTYRTSCINATDSICRRAQMESQSVVKLGQWARVDDKSNRSRSACGNATCGMFQHFQIAPLLRNHQFGKNDIMAPAWKLRHDLEWIGHADFHRVRPGAGHKPVVPASAVAKPSTLASESKSRNYPKDNIARRMDALSASAASLAADPDEAGKAPPAVPFPSAMRTLPDKRPPFIPALPRRRPALYKA